MQSNPLLADIFSQLSDSSGTMEMQKFTDYLREVLSLPAAVFEGPTFGFCDTAVKQCFDGVSRRRPKLRLLKIHEKFTRESLNLEFK